ncbi:MAG: hypothetical protein AB3N22_11835 [Ruegeria sp.]
MTEVKYKKFGPDESRAPEFFLGNTYPFSDFNATFPSARDVIASALACDPTTGSAAQIFRGIVVEIKAGDFVAIRIAQISHIEIRFIEVPYTRSTLVGAAMFET